ncbi:uncharacterized protein HD556DRAFT_1537093 [Suillus plorans]|uniref:Uncharacterized protein n=1 Tax=Suillus plorans TaxID=116603 RepID=A0A9P7AND8_9AGAM|nr:uncharacterized protein HD556DRAFT_1537093 [Suillus plorans]KAG1792020.1 hypothetical protein HD556DRAFT_1537093 [Suillus plorans]
MAGMAGMALQRALATLISEPNYSWHGTIKLRTRQPQPQTLTPDSAPDFGPRLAVSWMSPPLYPPSPFGLYIATAASLIFFDITLAFLMKMLETERQKYSFVYPVRKLAPGTRLAIEKRSARRGICGFRHIRTQFIRLGEDARRRYVLNMAQGGSSAFLSSSFLLSWAPEISME